MDSEQVCSLISKLVSKIIPVYKQVSLDWAGYAEKNNFLRFNQKSVKIADIFENKNYRGVLDGYVGYLNEYVELRETFVETTPSMQTFSRVKTLNSIQDKLAEYYYWRREKNGDVSCNKCFNDLYGIRTIIDVDDVPDLSFLAVQYPGLVTVNPRRVPPNASGYPYVATHIYFKIDNNSFKWELQVWSKKDEAANQLAHKDHRYKYTDWETEVTDDV